MSGKCGLEFFGVAKWLFLFYLLTYFHVCAPDCPGKVKTLLEQKNYLLSARMLPIALSAQNTVGAPELSPADGCNENFNSPRDPGREWESVPGSWSGARSRGGRPPSSTPSQTRKRACWTRKQVTEGPAACRTAPTEDEQPGLFLSLQSCSGSHGSSG